MSAGSGRIAGVLLAILTITRAAWPQESRATIVGRVTDSSGAVVPGATVSFANVETGVVVRTQTNGEGNYFSSFLIPGTYRIVGEKEGFKSLVRSGITLSVNSHQHVIRSGNDAEECPQAPSGHTPDPVLKAFVFGMGMELSFFVR